MDRLEYQPLAIVEVEEVRPDPHGFTLSGHGRDHAPYQIGLRFEMPLDATTRAVLGELLSQAELTVSRSLVAGGGSARPRERAHKR